MLHLGGWEDLQDKPIGGHGGDNNFDGFPKTPVRSRVQKEWDEFWNIPNIFGLKGGMDPADWLAAFFICIVIGGAGLAVGCGIGYWLRAAGL